MDPGKCIDQMEEAYVQHFGIKLDKKHRSPLKKGAILIWILYLSLMKKEKKSINHS